MPMNLSQRCLSIAALTAVLTTAACSGGGGGGGGSTLPFADPQFSSFEADVSFGTPADGLSQVQLDVLLADAHGAPIEGVELELVASGFFNDLVQPAPTDANGRARGFLSSTVGESKQVQLRILAGAQPSALPSVATEFVRLLPRTYFVRQGGADGNSGDAPLQAWATLAHAFDQLQPGDTLHVGAGSYASARLSTVASAAQPLHILADTLGIHTGDAGQVSIDAAGTDFGLCMDGASFITLRGFTIYGAQPGSRFGGGIWISDAGSQNLNLLDCQLFDNTRSIDVQRASDLVVEGCSVSNNQEDGIRLGLTAETRILNNLIYNNGGSGLNLVKVNGGLTVGLNTMYANLGSHLVESLSVGSSAFVTGNLFTDGGAASMEVNDSSAGLFVGDVNLSFGNPREASDLPGIGESIIEDPMYVDVDGADNVLGGYGHADDDFRLEDSSAAIDAGVINSNQLELSVAGSAATKSTSISSLLDGQGTDGALINLGFHRPLSQAAYASALPSETRISYATGSDALIRTVLRPSAQVLWDPVQDSLLTNSGVKWLTHRLAPEGPEEVLAALVDTGNATELYLRHWNGRHWSDNLSLPVVRTIERANAGERGFDLAYEQSSSDALFVYSNNDSNPLFRSLSNGVWSDPLAVFPSALGSGVVLWVELIPEAGSDRIAMIALDDAQALSATVWNGSSWESPILLGTQIVELREFHSFAGAWESLSGNLMVMWGFSIYAEQARYAVLDNASKTWSGTQLYTNSEAVGSVIRMQSDPGSDRIALAWGEGNTDDDVVVSTWDGKLFTNTRELTLTGQNGQHLTQVGWIGKTGKAFAIYRNRNANTFERARFDTFWKFESPIQLPQMGRAVRAEILPNAGDDFAEVLILDANGALFGFEVRFEGQGTVWTLTNGGEPLAEGLSLEASTQAFGANRRPSISSSGE